ncbi:MAG TPA: hypothetical protein VGJ06_05165 [Candidatus Acidoferrum sp.]|jgi:hypothetical protein
MWFLFVFGVAWLGILVYQFLTGRPIYRSRFFGQEVEQDSELFWAFYAFQVFGFVSAVGYFVWILYFKGR